jgi:hypothetical protein
MQDIGLLLDTLYISVESCMELRKLVGDTTSKLQGISCLDQVRRLVVIIFELDNKMQNAFNPDIQTTTENDYVQMITAIEDAWLHLAYPIPQLSAPFFFCTGPKKLGEITQLEIWNCSALPVLPALRSNMAGIQQSLVVIIIISIENLP